MVEPVNETNAIAEAIRASGCICEDLDFVLGEMPTVGRGRVECEVYEEQFGRVVYSRDLPDLFNEGGKKKGFKEGFISADPLAALKYIGRIPTQEESRTWVVLFVNKYGHPRFLSIYEDCNKRYIHLGYSYDLLSWGGSVRFLVVPCEELPLAT